MLKLQALRQILGLICVMRHPNVMIMHSKLPLTALRALQYFVMVIVAFACMSKADIASINDQHQHVPE